MFKKSTQTNIIKTDFYFSFDFQYLLFALYRMSPHLTLNISLSMDMLSIFHYE